MLPEDNVGQSREVQADGNPMLVPADRTRESYSELGLSLTLVS